MKKFLLELGVNQKKFVVYCDNQKAIYLAENPTFHARTKHVDIRYHWIRDVVESKLLYLDNSYRSKWFRHDD